MNKVVDHIRRAVLHDSAGLSDRELLDRFIDSHDEAALVALVKRHGPMVWGVCRRLLGHHDAEDAFQATFLVLVRKAASIVPREMVGNWLYGVAHQTALQTRRALARRNAREGQVTTMPDPAAVQPDLWHDIQPLLDRELSCLPDIYRAAIVLCDLEGRTRKEVANLLGVPEGTVAGRLARARAMLAKRLTARGVTVSGVVLSAVLMEKVASTDIPIAVLVSAIRTVEFAAAGRVAVSAQVGTTRSTRIGMKRAPRIGWPAAGSFSSTRRTAGRRAVTSLSRRPGAQVSGFESWSVGATRHGDN